MGDVPPAIGDPCCGVDSEVGVCIGLVGRESRSGRVDVIAVIEKGALGNTAGRSRAVHAGVVARYEGVGGVVDDGDAAPGVGVRAVTDDGVSLGCSVSDAGEGIPVCVVVRDEVVVGVVVEQNAGVFLAVGARAPTRRWARASSPQ